jgi:hypothetical protein
MYNGFDFGKTEIFFRSGLDKAETQVVADLPVGQITGSNQPPESATGGLAWSAHAAHEDCRSTKKRDGIAPVASQLS